MCPGSLMPLASLLDHFPSWLTNNLGIALAVVIVVVGLFVIGLADTIRLSMTRIWAISGVCFDESVRRRILWIIPLAALGVILVVQLQHPSDEQDAVRETLKFCLFDTGLVVVVTAVILACTSLPREIENRVIYTVVTKPTTRLEVVLGKTVGFARVSALIVVIMGLFTYLYVELRTWSMDGYIDDRLKQTSLSITQRSSLQHYRSVGLMEARQLEAAVDMNIMGRDKDSDGRRWLYGETEEECLVPFSLDLNLYGDQVEKYGLIITANASWVKYKDSAPTQAAEVVNSTAVGPFALTPNTGHVPFVPGPTKAITRPTAPAIVISMSDENGYGMIDPEKFDKYPFADPKKPAPASSLTLSDDGKPTDVSVFVPPNLAAELTERSMFFVRIAGLEAGYRFGVSDDPARMFVPDPAGPRPVPRLMSGPGTFTPLIFRGKPATVGLQLRGGTDDDTPLAVFNFRSKNIPDDQVGIVHMEFSAGVELASADVPEDRDDPTEVDMVIRNLDHPSPPANLTLYVENRGTAFFDVPGDAVRGGNFQVAVRARNNGHILGLLPISVRLVTAQQSFTVNLIKSLFILWMMSALVVAISVFCSTFVSWPIAVVLTLVLLTGHWVVSVVGDTNSVSIARSFIRDMFPDAQDASQIKAATSSIQTLVHMLNVVSDALPDISKFDAIDDIERGHMIPFSALLAASEVTVGFGLPLTVLAYVFLKFKEVAP